MWGARALISVFVLLAAACGSDDGGGASTSPGGGNGAGGGSQEVQSLNVSVSAAVAETATLWLAEYEGYFEDENLDVSISVDGGNVTGNVVGGRADIGVTGIGGSLAATNEGRDTSIIYWWSGHGGSGFVTGQADLDGPEDCGSVASMPEGTAAYGWAEWYRANLDVDWPEIVTVPDIPTLVAAFQSGQHDCVVITGATFVPFVEDGSAQFLVDPRDPDGLPEGLADFDLVEAAAFGLADNLPGKQEAVERFIRALDRAAELMESASAEELASIIVEGDRDATWAGHDEDSLTVGFEVAVFFTAPNGGYVPPEAWDTEQLEFFVSGGLPFIDPEDETWSYEQRVDMTYHEGALGR